MLQSGRTASGKTVSGQGSSGSEYLICVEMGRAEDGKGEMEWMTFCASEPVERKTDTDIKCKRENKRK